MITDNDIKKLKTVFATKEDLKAYTTKEDLRAYATKMDLIDFKDAILHEIRDLRDDITVTTGYRDMLEDHENRLEVVETKLATSQ